MSPDDTRTVWSSEAGDLRKQKQEQPSAASLPAKRQTAYLHREAKGRGGKAVTLIRNLILSEAELSALAKKIKQACGTGGTVKDGVIEVQGANRERIAEVLVKLGYKIKMAGG